MGVEPCDCEYHIHLARALESLPCLPACNEAERLRSTLQALFSSALSKKEVVPVEARPEYCPSCSDERGADKSPYCSEPCKEQSAFIRQLRKAVVDGSIRLAEKQEVMGQTWWHLAGGGYPARVLLVPARVVDQVIAKSRGCCTSCGAVATTVDHARTACNRPINLRAVCGSCSKDVPAGDPKIIESETYKRLLLSVGERLGCCEPARCCDDPISWDWRKFLALRAS